MQNHLLFVVVMDNFCMGQWVGHAILFRSKGEEAASLVTIPLLQLKFRQAMNLNLIGN
jgi:hypothetical protein